MERLCCVAINFRCCTVSAAVAVVVVTTAAAVAHGNIERRVSEIFLTTQVLLAARQTKRRNATQSNATKPKTKSIVAVAAKWQQCLWRNYMASVFLTGFYLHSGRNSRKFGSVATKMLWKL